MWFTASSAGQHSTDTGLECARETHSDDGGLLAAGVLDQLARLERNLDQRLEALLSVALVLGLVLAVLLDVQTDRRALAAGAGETDDEPRAVLERDVQALVLAHGVVDRVGVGKVASLGDLERGRGRGGRERGADKVGRGKRRLELLDDLGRGVRLDLLVVVSVKTQ